LSSSNRDELLRIARSNTTGAESVVRKRVSVAGDCGANENFVSNSRIELNSLPKNQILPEVNLSLAVHACRWSATNSAWGLRGSRRGFRCGAACLGAAFKPVVIPRRVRASGDTPSGGTVPVDEFARHQGCETAFDSWNVPNLSDKRNGCSSSRLSDADTGPRSATHYSTRPKRTLQRWQAGEQEVVRPVVADSGTGSASPVNVVLQSHNARLSGAQSGYYVSLGDVQHSLNICRLASNGSMLATTTSLFARSGPWGTRKRIADASERASATGPVSPIRNGLGVPPRCRPSRTRCKDAGLGADIIGNGPRLTDKTFEPESKIASLNEPRPLHRGAKLRTLPTVARPLPVSTRGPYRNAVGSRSTCSVELGVPHAKLLQTHRLLVQELIHRANAKTTPRRAHARPVTSTRKPRLIRHRPANSTRTLDAGVVATRLQRHGNRRTGIQALWKSKTKRRLQLGRRPLYSPAADVQSRRPERVCPQPVRDAMGDSTIRTRNPTLTLTQKQPSDLIFRVGAEA